MTGSDGFYRIILFFTDVAGAYHYPMGNDRDRVISITLSEAEWQAFIARQPQPVDWLRQQIRNQVEVAPPRKESQSAA
jgi:hypothetical protein